jgi:hypothetical protein
VVEYHPPLVAETVRIETVVEDTQTTPGEPPSPDDLPVLTAQADESREVLEPVLADLYTWALATYPDETEASCGVGFTGDDQNLAWSPGYRANDECGQHLSGLIDEFWPESVPVPATNAGSWYAIDQPVGSDMFDVADTPYGLVATNTDGLWLSTDNGQTWEPYARDQVILRPDDRVDVSSFARVAHSDAGTLVINTSHGDTWLSTDGSTWTQVASAPADHLDRLYAFDGGYLLLKLDGTQQFSNDGIEWTETVLPAHGRPVETAFGYFIGGESRLWWSADGTDWEAVATEVVTGEDGVAVLASANRIVALSDQGSWYTDDGTNWNGPHVVGHVSPFAALGSEIGFVAYRYRIMGSELSFSEDGIGWAPVPFEGEQPPGGVRGIIAIPNGFLMYGLDLGDTGATVWMYQR